MRPHGKAVIDVNDPRRTALCQRCGDLHNLYALKPQYLWAGTQLIDTGLRVCERCLDIPAPFERSMILPPDPPPTIYALQNGLPVDMVSQWTMQAPPGANMFQAQGLFEAVGTRYYFPNPLFRPTASFAGDTTAYPSTVVSASATIASYTTAYPITVVAGHAVLNSKSTVYPKNSYQATSGLSASPNAQAKVCFGIIATNPEEYASVLAPGKPTPFGAKLQILFGDS